MIDIDAITPEILSDPEFIRDIWPRLPQGVQRAIERILASVERPARPDISLVQFVRDGWHVLEPATPYIHGWHIDVICEHLEAVSRGEIQKIIFNVPPGSMKSLLCAVFFPAWEWTFAPHLRFLTASYIQTYSTRDAMRSRTLMKSEWYRENWGQMFDFSGDQDMKTRYENTRRGFRHSTSVGGGATGERGHRKIIDDPIDPKKADSEDQRENVIRWHKETWSSRNVNANTASIVIMQRLHERDLTGHLLNEGGY